MFPRSQRILLEYNFFFLLAFEFLSQIFIQCLTYACYPFTNNDDFFFFFSFVSIVRKPLRLLKAYQCIPSHTDVPESFLSYLNVPPPPYDHLGSKDASHDSSFIDVQLAVLKHYICWRLEMQPEEFDSIMKTYCRLKHRSFRLVEKSLKILEEKLGFSKEKVNHHQ